MTIKTTRTRNGWRYRLTKRLAAPLVCQAKHSRLKMSGLQWQVWMHYAAGANGAGSSSNENLAIHLECSPNKISEYRTHLLNEGPLVRSFRGIVVPHWLR
jgi:hypothetical protein